MTDKAKIGYGVSIIRNTTLFGELAEAQVPTPEVGEVSATTHDSPNRLEQVVAGLIKNGQASFTINYLGTATQDALMEDVWNCATDLWTFVLPVAFSRAWQFSGFIKRPELVTPIGDKVQLKVTIVAQTKPVLLKTPSAGLTTPFVAMTNQASEALVLSPAAANATRYYQVTSYSDDTGVKITPTAAAGTIYVDGTVVATGVASGAITIGTTTGSVTQIPVLVWEANKIPAIYLFDVTKGTVASPP